MRGYPIVAADCAPRIFDHAPAAHSLTTMNKYNVTLWASKDFVPRTQLVPYTITEPTSSWISSGDDEIMTRTQTGQELSNLPSLGIFGYWQAGGSM